MNFSLYASAILLLATAAAASPFKAGYHAEFNATQNQFWNLLTFGYRFNNGLQLEAQAQGNHVFNGNPRFGISSLIFPETLWTKRAVLWANINIEAPIATRTKANEQGPAPGSYQIFRYLPVSRWSFEAHHWLRVYTYSTDKPWIDVRGNLTPFINYRFNPNVGVNLGLSFDYFHFKGLGWLSPRNEDFAFQAGWTWSPTNWLTLRPFIAVQKGGDAPQGPVSANIWISSWFD